jgi:hypothetical protein
MKFANYLPKCNITKKKTVVNKIMKQIYYVQNLLSLRPKVFEVIISEGLSCYFASTKVAARRRIYY